MRIRDPLRVDGLENLPDEPRGIPALPDDPLRRAVQASEVLFGELPRGHDDDGNVAARGLLADPVEDLEAVRGWHHEVEKDGGGPLAFDRGDRLRAPRDGPRRSRPR